MQAYGIIDAVGLSTAMYALDAACKAADVELIGVEDIIGGPNMMAISVHITGDVAAVNAAVDAGTEAGNRVGTIIGSHVIPRPHDDVQELVEEFDYGMKEREDKRKNDNSSSSNKEATENKANTNENKSTTSDNKSNTKNEEKSPQNNQNKSV